jgi:hypothetical protein
VQDIRGRHPYGAVMRKAGAYLRQYTIHVSKYEPKQTVVLVEAEEAERHEGGWSIVEDQGATLALIERGHVTRLAHGKTQFTRQAKILMCARFF